MAGIPIITDGRKVGDLMSEYQEHAEPWKDGFGKNNIDHHGALTYPLHKQDRYNAKIVFDPHVIIPPSGAGAILGDLLMDTSYWAGFSRKELKVQKPKSSELSPRKEQSIHQPIKMYLPVAYTVNDGFDYAAAGLGIAGAGAMGVMSSGQSVNKAAVDMINSGVKSIGDLFQGNGSSDLGRLGLVRGLASTKMPTDLQNSTSLAVAVSVNPNVRAVFGGVSIREFSFQFKFIPKSPEEALEVERIIKRFRVAAYPESIELANGVSGGYKYPFLFDIKLNYDTEKGTSRRIGTKMEKCFLKAISTNYNPTTMAFHADGHPVEIDLALTFVEQKTIDKKMVRDKGY